MANAGELAEVVNAELVELTNQTDSEDYGQLYNVRWSSTFPTHKRVSIDKTEHHYTGLPSITIAADILITKPEVTTFVGYNQLSGGDLPTKNWDLKVTAFDTTTDTIRIVGKMTGLDFIGPEEGDSWFHITITSDTGVITEP